MCILLVAVLVCAFYFWTASSNTVPFRGRGDQLDYYNRLSHGFQSGHLSMQVAPLGPGETKSGDPALGDLPFLLDASFYQGRYYLYFGPTPVLTAFLPYRLLTGGDISDNLVAALFSCAGFLVSLRILWFIRRRFFPAAPSWITPLLAVALGFGNACAIMLRHPMFYEAAIACAYFFFFCFLENSLKALVAQNRGQRWFHLALASAAFGLTVGARANYAAVGVVLVGIVGYLGRRDSRRSVAWLTWLSGLAPAGLCALGLMAYNYARFGRVLEFGVTYQFTYKPIFSPRFAPFNLKLYYFSLPELSWYFPFTLPIDEGQRPAGYVGFEFLHGEAWALPLFALVLVGWFKLWQRGRERPLAVWFTAALAAYLINLGVLLCLGGRANRYMVDFQPTLLIVASVGAWLFARELVSPLWRYVCGMGLVVLIAAGAFHNGFASLQLYELWRYASTRTYDRISTFANHPSHWAGPWLYPRLGPIRLLARFPDDRAGHCEPILVTGSANYADFIAVRYLGNQQIRFEFGHQGYEVITGAAMTVRPGETHQVEIDLGSLYPPAAHPFFDAFGRGERAQIVRTVRVRLDGKPVLSTQHDVFDASPGRVYVGKNPFAPLYAEPRFSGTISDITRAGLAPLLARKNAESSGPVVLDLRLPTPLAPRKPEPLVVTGETNRGDGLLLEYEDATHIRLAWDHWGLNKIESAPLQIDPSVQHRVEVWMGSLFPAKDDPLLVNLPEFLRNQLKHSLRVKLDGREVFNARGDFHEAAPRTVDVGGNFIGLSSCSSLFGGEILGYSRLQTAYSSVASAAGAHAGAVQMRLVFPEFRQVRREPLLATGNSVAGDVVYVAYVDPHTVQFSYHHSGSPVLTSAPVKIDYGTEQEIKIDFGGLHAPDRELARVARAAAAVGNTRLRIELNGQEVVSADVSFHTVPEDALAIAQMPFALADCDAAFTGAINRLERPEATRPRAAAPTANYGPVRLKVILPRDRVGKVEPILVTGHPGAADAVNVRYVDATHVSFQWDHWGVGGPESAPVLLNYDAAHDLEITMGSLFPEGAVELVHDLADGELATLRTQLRVTLDGTTVLAATGKFHAVSATELMIAANSVGLSSAEREFTGAIEAYARPGLRHE